jgi:NAD(P)-dependent dehydrogenase (short-subunit alcohol dehydrogenase family)
MEPPEQAFREGVATWQPMKKVGLARDVASTAVWLLSEASGFVNGADIPVDGGISAGRPASVGLPARAAMAAAFKKGD